MTISAPPIIAVERARQRRRRIWRRCLRAGAVVVLVLLAWHAVSRLSNALAMRRLEAAARQRGEPLTLAELVAKEPLVPDKDNAALPLLALWEKEDPAFWQAFRKDQQPLPGRFERNYNHLLPYLAPEAPPVQRSLPLDPAVQKVAQDWLNSRQAHLEAVRQALRLPRCRFPLRFHETFSAPLPYLEEVRTEAANFRIEALLAQERGDSDQAIAALADLVRTGNLLADEPLLVSQLTRISCLTAALGSAERLLSRQALSPAQLERLRSLFESMDTRGALRRAFIGERAIVLSASRQPAQAFADPVPGAWETQLDTETEAKEFRFGVRWMEATGLLARDRRLILETMDKAIRLAGDDTAKAFQETEEIFRNAAAQAAGFPRRVFSSLLLSGMERACAKFAAFEARRRAAMAALALEACRQAHAGALPDKLDALVPQFLARVPADPFDGQPLRYRRLPKGYVVYSVGADRMDDGGRERKTPGKGSDEPFFVER